MAFQYQPYDNSGSIGQILALMQAGARAHADAARASGEAQARAMQIKAQNSAQLAGSLGSIIGNAGQQIAQGYQQYQQDKPRREIEALQLQGLKDEQTAKQGAAQRQSVVDSLLRDSLTEDPETGVVTYDRKKLQTGLTEAGMGHLWGQYSKLLDESDTAIKGVKAARQDALRRVATIVDASGNDAAVFTNEVQRAIKNGVISEQDAAPYIAAAQRDPAHIGRITAAILGKEPKQPEAFTLSPGQQRFNADGTPIASVAKEPDAPKVGSLEDYIARVAASKGRRVDQLTPSDLRAARSEYEAAGRAPEKDTEPLVAIMGPDGQSVLVPRSQAVGKRPASGREQGRPVTSGDAGRIADYDTSLDDLAVLRETVTPKKGPDGKPVTSPTGTSAKIGASLPKVVTDLTGWGTEAKSKQAVIDRVKQVIGKALEGGVLRKEDEYKYEKILPTIGDTAEVVESKLRGLATAITKRRQTQIDALDDAGYDVSKFKTRAPHGQSGASVDPLGIRKQ